MFPAAELFQVLFWPFIFLAVAIVGITAIIGLYSIFFAKERGVEKSATLYQYGAKKFFMTCAEHECYDALVAAVGSEYYVFPQVHLPAIVDNKVAGQNWAAAFRHINGKSIDFVLCDKAYISTKLAIELDDKTHERSDRVGRDAEVERILKQAGVPLLRLRNNGGFSADSLRVEIKTSVISDSQS